MSQIKCATEKQLSSDLCPVLLIVCHCKNPSCSAGFCGLLLHKIFASSHVFYMLDKAKGVTGFDLSFSHTDGV